MQQENIINKNELFSIETRQKIIFKFFIFSIFVMIVYGFINLSIQFHNPLPSQGQWGISSPIYNTRVLGNGPIEYGLTINGILYVLIALISIAFGIVSLILKKKIGNTQIDTSNVNLKQLRNYKIFLSLLISCPIILFIFNIIPNIYIHNINPGDANTSYYVNAFWIVTSVSSNEIHISWTIMFPALLIVLAVISFIGMVVTSILAKNPDIMVKNNMFVTNVIQQFKEKRASFKEKIIALKVKNSQKREEEKQKELEIEQKFNVLRENLKNDEMDLKKVFEELPENKINLTSKRFGSLIKDSKEKINQQKKKRHTITVPDQELENIFKDLEFDD